MEYRLAHLGLRINGHVYHLLLARGKSILGLRSWHLLRGYSIDRPLLR